MENRPSSGTIILDGPLVYLILVAEAITTGNKAHQTNINIECLEYNTKTTKYTIRKWFGLDSCWWQNYKVYLAVSVFERK